MALLEVTGISKNFGSTHVLQNISLNLEKGEALAIIGSSGSGKTTLLRCLNFLETPDTGVIRVDGKTLWDAADPATHRESEVRKKRLHFGLVFQNFNLFPQYTALQNITLAGELLDFFSCILQCFHDGDEMEHASPLPCFSDLLKEEYLWSEEYDEEEDEMRYEEDEVFPDDLFYSFYYYSWQAVKAYQDVLEQVPAEFAKPAAEVLELL